MGLIVLIPNTRGRRLFAGFGNRPTVYLDMNHWIGLAQAAAGHPHGVRHRAALEVLRAAGDRVVIPLASVHFMEMEGNRNARQRGDVAEIMEEFSGFACLAPRSDVAKVEIDAALARLVGTPHRFAHAPRLGFGVVQAFGRRGGLRIFSVDEGDITPRAREQWRGGPGEFDAFSRRADIELTRAVLRGPEDEATTAELRTHGWDPTTARRIASDRARVELELQAMLAAEPVHRSRLRDVVSARYLARDLLDSFNEAVQACAVFAEVRNKLAAIDAARSFTDSMPAGDAWISLVSLAHRNPQSRWRANDILDFDALSVAIPYADLVVTDKHACQLARRAGLPDRLGTIVIHSTDELPAALEELL